MSSTSTADAARKFISEVWNATDGAERISAWLAPGYIDHAYGGSEAELRNAVQELRSAFSDARFEVEGVVAAHDQVAVRLRMFAIQDGPFRGHAARGGTVEVKVFRWFRFAGDRIAEHWALFDTAGLMRQLAA